MKKKNKKQGKITRKPLTLRERIEIEKLYYYGESISNIAKKLKRQRSTIYREINGSPRTGIGRYRADVSHDKALKRISKRGNKRILDKNEELKNHVIAKLKEGWSPEQIAGRLKKVDYPDDKSMHISYEAIYQYIYAQIHREGNGKVKKGCIDLRMYLPRRHKRRATKGARKAKKLERRASLPSIDERPDIVDKRTRVGDWEDDLVVSRASKACVKSISERKSGVVFFLKISNKTAKEADNALVEKLKKIPSPFRLTLTRDRGTENMNWEYVKQALDIDVYFAHPYHSWERGSNENNNGLLRRYFPKGTDFAKISDEELARVEYLLNTRPRKRLGFKTPAEVFYEESKFKNNCVY